MSKIVRLKARCGITASWRIGKTKAGKFRAVGLSKARMGRNPIPLDFVPFEMSNAVMNGPSFETEGEAEAFVRSI